MRKAIALLLVAFVCLAGVTAGGSGESGSGDTYKIGFIGPLTGDNANYGIRCSNAARLAINEINAAGGVDGKMLELIAEDSEGTVDKALAAYEKLAYMDEVCAIIGPVFTSPALAVAQRCQEDGIVMISPSATHKDVTAQPATNPDGLNYVFRTVPSDALQSEVAGYYFYEVLGYRKLASLYAMNDYSQGLALGMKDIFESLGGEVVAEETCMVGDKDFRTQLTRIKAANPEAIYIPNYTVEDAQILEQASQLGVNVRFLLQTSRQLMQQHTMEMLLIHSQQTAMMLHISSLVLLIELVLLIQRQSATKLQLQMTSREQMEHSISQQMATL